MILLAVECRVLGLKKSATALLGALRVEKGIDPRQAGGMTADSSMPNASAYTGTRCFEPRDRVRVLAVGVCSFGDPYLPNRL